jgi:hypothetical protein
MHEIYFMNLCSKVDNIAGLFDVLFSWKFFVPLSRLTYSTYLIHLTVIQFDKASMMTPGYLSDYNMVSTTPVAYGRRIRPAVQVMTRQTSIANAHSCSRSGSHSLGVSMSYLWWAISTPTRVLRLTATVVWAPLLPVPISNIQSRRYINSAIYIVFKSQFSAALSRETIVK